jgi:uncharacterized membrane protein
MTSPSRSSTSRHGISIRSLRLQRRNKAKHSLTVMVGLCFAIMVNAICIFLIISWEYLLV